MYENKFRIPADIKLMRRGRINEYLHDLLGKHHCLFLQGIAGSSKTYTLYSLILEYYKDRYIYYHLDQDDNNIDAFKEHMSLAFQYASLNLSQIDKPYLFVLDQFEAIENTQVLATLKTFIEYRHNNLDIIIASKYRIPETLRDYMIYHKLFLVEDCNLFYDRSELVQIQKNYSRKKIDPYQIYKITQGWPVLVNYYLYHPTDDIDNAVINNFFEHLPLTSQMLKILQIVSLTNYTTKDLLETFGFENLEVDLHYLYNVSLLYNNHQQIQTIPLLASYYQRVYKDLEKDILKQALSYYIEHHYTVDILYCYYHLDDEHLLPYIKENVYAIESICNNEQFNHLIERFSDNHDKEILYLKGIQAYKNNDIEQYHHILNLLINHKQLYYNLAYRHENVNYNQYHPFIDDDTYLYHVTDNSASILHGIKDITYIYKYKYSNPKYYRDIKQKLNNSELLYFELGEIEYYFYTGQHKKALEQLEYYVQDHQSLSIDLYMIVAGLYFKIYYCLGLSHNAITYFEQYATPIVQSRDNYQLSIHLNYFNVYIDCLLHRRDNVYNWYRENRIDENVNHDNCFHIYLQARYYYMSERYETANLYYHRLEAYFRKQNSIILLSECIFAVACCLYGMNDKAKALSKATEAFTLGGGYKLVFPYITYDTNGLEVLKMYNDIINEEDTKKKYYSNNIINKPYKKYLEDIIKENKKLIKLYPYEQVNQYDLTLKEKEVLKCIIKGDTNKDISQELVISISTVKTHVSNIYSKLGVKNRTQAIKIAKENNIID